MARVGPAEQGACTWAEPAGQGAWVEPAGQGAWAWVEPAGQGAWVATGKARSLDSSGTASGPAVSSWMASRPCGMEEAFLCLWQERGSSLTASRGATVSSAASGVAAAGPFFLLLRFTGHLRAGAPTDCRWKGGGAVSGVWLRLEWGFRLPTMVDVVNNVTESKISQLLHLPQAERLDRGRCWKPP